MLDTYDVEHFELDYCHEDVSKIITAIQTRASLVAVGMPGCGKSRLVDFLLHRPGVLDQYGLSDRLKLVQVECDLVTTGPQGMIIELLRALNTEAPMPGQVSLDWLRNRLISEVGGFDVNTDLAIIFDNFTQEVQQSLDESFFSFLFALRNTRPKLNLIYIFVANLKIDFAGFFKLDRLFDQGADRSICWISPLNRKDTFFSINRQLSKTGHEPEFLSQTQKGRIYELGGGHALLTRYLTHLMLSGEVSLETEPDQVLNHSGIRAACEAIWDDLAHKHKNFLIDLAANRFPAGDVGTPARVLRDYGVLNEEEGFFSPVFQSFVSLHKKAKTVIGIRCEQSQTRLTIRTHDEELYFELQGLSQRKRRLLCYLVENQGDTCRKDQLIAVGWPLDYHQGVSDQALSKQIDGIRSWLKKAEQLSQYIAIETAWGEGYQLLLKD